MKFMNKKVLAAAVVGLLASGNALAAAQIQTTNTIYAKEIALPTSLTVPVSYRLGYNFNTNETRYACVRLTGASFPSGPIASPSITGLVAPTDLTAGVVNKVGTNVVFFTLSSNPSAAVPSTHDAIINLAALALTVNTYADDAVKAFVGLYDNPASAGNCLADSQLIPDTWSEEPLVKFRNAFTFTIDSHLATASVEATPSYSTFKAGSGLTAFAGGVGPVTLASNAKLTLLGGGTYLKADGNPIALADIFPASAQLKFEGNFDNDWLAASNFNGALVVASDEESATSPAFDPSTYLIGANAFTVTANSTGEIPTGIYKASMTVAPRTGYTLNYVVGTGSGAAVTLTPVIDEALVATGDTVVTEEAANGGQIVQDGVKLLTPLVQLAGGDWLARLAISNTGAKDRTFTLKAQGFDSEGESSTVTTPNVTYTVKAGTTYVFDNLANVLNFNGRARGTVTAIVNAPELEVKGVYQLVNTSANTISNINMINVSNSGTGNGH